MSVSNRGNIIWTCSHISLALTVKQRLAVCGKFRDINLQSIYYTSTDLYVYSLYIISLYYLIAYIDYYNMFGMSGAIRRLSAWRSYGLSLGLSYLQTFPANSDRLLKVYRHSTPSHCLANPTSTLAYGGEAPSSLHLYLAC